MPEYINPNNHPVHLVGPNGEIIKIASRQKVVLPEFFDKYRKRGFIKLTTNVRPIQTQSTNKLQAQIKLRIDENRRKKEERKAQISESKSEPRKKGKVISINVQKEKERLAERRIALEQSKKQLVGRATGDNGIKILAPNLDIGYPISNNIAVGILSYNRKHCLQRLVDSIEKYTDLNRTTVFISDDCSTNQDLIDYLDHLSESNKVVILRNDQRLGIAGNTNRLLDCMARFKYGILLNDDVEVLKADWEGFYIHAMHNTNMHHFIYRQQGVYGAEIGSRVNISGFDCYYNDSKPQGSVLAYSNEAFKKVGYFDEAFGLYGMEHVDWSRRIYESGMQREGYFDIVGSDKYFRIHNEQSAMENRAEHLRVARELYNEKYLSRRNAYYVNKSEKVVVPSISYVVPFRNIDRTGAIETIIQNIKAQKFPKIEIIIVEHDNDCKIALDTIGPVSHYLIASNGALFNKSQAFNLGVSKITSESVVLQDADILLRGDYTHEIYNVLRHYKSCHIGRNVIYADPDTTSRIIRDKQVSGDLVLNRVVGYFEGGSLACRADEYWRCGAYNEDFWGYGCEDCDFYARMSSNTEGYYGIRTADFLHLHHGRTAGWDAHHQANKIIQQSLNLKNMEDRIKLQHSQLKRLGYLKTVEGNVEA